MGGILYDAAAASMLVLTWNLFHGRSVPSAGENLCQAFAAQLARWQWDVALLQEVPPWWPPSLAAAAGALERAVRTSRNAGLALRRPLAERWPDVMKSNGGGANAILSRIAITEDRSLRLRRWPERRVAQLVRLAGGACVANLHASTRVALAEVELRRLWEEALAFARGEPLVLGGDLNLRSPKLPTAVGRHVASRDVDHLFAAGLEPAADPRTLDRRVSIGGRDVELSDHPPLAVDLR